ncbi:RNAse P Rpr2 Rpp21 subunit domain [Cryptosporidium sp. chipmunk genotype I]|uniref:RNAse P Rpr2 Rpp21 subunit domain n=1 Tax=Cryptosporidium sp. chipmunk genotype I TaxID=1280935 RepID=UPI003519F392|nr:RNAse P Rpr2 Rpp21 subunit domain [Cryptosporidium sp. chipmunk genotype I]
MKQDFQQNFEKKGETSSVAPAYHRMNFLLQVSQQYALVSNELSRYCYSQAREISRKKLARIDPESRRLWCKRCYTHFISGITCELALEDKIISNGNSDSNSKNIIQTNIFNKCSYCNWKKRHSYTVFGEFKDEEENAMIS